MIFGTVDANGNAELANGLFCCPLTRFSCAISKIQKNHVIYDEFIYYQIAKSRAQECLINHALRINSFQKAFQLFAFNIFLIARNRLLKKRISVVKCYNHLIDATVSKCFVKRRRAVK